MTDTIWADISDWNPIVTDAYPHRWLSFRCNDGTMLDAHVHENYGWAQHGIRTGKLDAFISYTVYRPDGGKWADTFMRTMGAPHPNLVIMVDVESWPVNGVPTIKGDHSADINAGIARIAKWAGNAARVIGYGNEADLNDIWPHRGGIRLVVAALGFNPTTPGKIAHQYTFTGDCPPFGKCDLNSADGISSTDLAALLGVATTEEDMTPEQAQQLADVHKAVVEASITSPGGPQKAWSLGHHVAFQSMTDAANKAILTALQTIPMTDAQIQSLAQTLQTGLGEDVAKILAQKLAS